MITFRSFVSPGARVCGAASFSSHVEVPWECHDTLVVRTVITCATAHFLQPRKGTMTVMMIVDHTMSAPFLDTNTVDVYKRNAPEDFYVA